MTPRPILLLVLALPLTAALFEDQAFKFDWKKVHVGKPKAARYGKHCSVLRRRRKRGS